MAVLQFIILSLGSTPLSIFLKTILYKESSQIGKRRFVVELLCVWCGSVSYPRAAVLGRFLIWNSF
jgi:hypothetical protein